MVGALPVVGNIADRILSLPGWLVLALVFALPALEASAFIGFVFPGEIAVILGGVVASQGRVPLWAVIVAAVAGAIIGDSIGYFIGRTWGSHLLHGTVGRLPIIRKHIDKHLKAAQDYVRRRKGRAVFFGRFTAALRVLVPGLAGMSDVHYPSFLFWNVAGGALWGIGFAFLGYVAGASYKRVEKIASRLGLGLLALIVLALILSRLLRHAGRLRTFGDRIAATPPFAWLRRRFPRQVAWLRRRLDVSDPRGFWLTFTVAIGAFATWAFVALTLDVVGHHDAALFDPRVERWVGTHRVAWVTTVMKTVTRLGSSVAIVPLLIAVAVILIARRRDWRSCLFLAAAVLGAVALYSIVKPAVDRTRPLPSMWIGRFGGDAFPSGHATLVTAFYGMVAVVLSIGRRARARVFLWTGAALITLLVGASPIYLGGHWFTDVLGGYALGAAWTAILVALMLLTTRQETAEPLAVTEVRESIAAQREGER